MPTLDELLAMPAGFELDRAVAKIQDGVDVIDSVARVMPISRNIKLAWPLMAEMLAAGCIMELGAGVHGLFLSRYQDGEHGKALADITDVPTIADAPLAIVRAWLCWKLGGAS